MKPSEPMPALIDTVCDTIRQSLETFAENLSSCNPQKLSADLVSTLTAGLQQCLLEAGRAGLATFSQAHETGAAEIQREGKTYRFKEVSSKTFFTIFGPLRLCADARSQVSLIPRLTPSLQTHPCLRCWEARMAKLKIFISYRRDDHLAKGLVGRFHERLAARYGIKNVFLDEEGVPSWTDFREILRQRVLEADVVVALIGPAWLGILQAKAQDPTDFVRFELETALQHGIKVAPVLLGDVAMPAEHELPPSLSSLSFLQAPRLDPVRDFNPQMTRIMADLERLPPVAKPKPPLPPKPKPKPPEKQAVPPKPKASPGPVKSSWGGAIVATALALAVLAAIFLLNRPPAIHPGADAGKELPAPAPTQAGERREIEIAAGVKVAFRWCPPGTFRMGSLETETGRGTDETPHTVVLTQGFWLAETETTQGQWQAIMGSNPSNFTSVGSQGPVENVSWDGIVKDFLPRIQASAPSGWRFALPTEAQWEYACRAGTVTPFSFGSALNGKEANCDGNYPYGTAEKGPYLKQTREVGSYGPNPWGFHDMHGNVWEWCSDWYVDDLGTQAVIDPRGPSSGTNRVNRGGGWFNYAVYCRSAHRSGFRPDGRSSNLGFRLALSPIP